MRASASPAPLHPGQVGESIFFPHCGIPFIPFLFSLFSLSLFPAPPFSSLFAPPHFITFCSRACTGTPNERSANAAVVHGNALSLSAFSADIKRPPANRGGGREGGGGMKEGAMPIPSDRGCGGSRAVRLSAELLVSPQSEYISMEMVY